MDAYRNPFAPGAGAPPPALAGRGQLLERANIALGRQQRGLHAKSLMLVGLRGVGKTVLLNRIRENAEAAGYMAVIAEAPEGKPLAALLIPVLRGLLFRLDRLGALSEQVKRGLRVFKSFARTVKLKVGEIEVGLDVDPEVGSADSGDLEADLPDMLAALGEAARARGTAVAIILDELQYVSELDLSALIMAVHRLSQRRLPVALVGAGLPQLVGLAGRSKSYAERLFDYPKVGALGDADAAAALAQPAAAKGVAFTAEALDEIVRRTEGYPYFLQEWGYQVWSHAAASPITLETVRAAEPAVIANLDESFFRVRFDRLTPAEKSYLRAMGALGPGPHRSGDIAEALGVGVRAVAPRRNGLIKKGMIYGPTHGDTAFTVPLFDPSLR